LKIGLEQLIENPPSLLHGKRLGLLMNQASVDQHYRLACHSIDEKFPGQLRCLFSPQHGIWGEQQANMIETQHENHAGLGIPVYSLYSETRSPTQSMLDQVDCIIIDLQDIGTRVYTFIWTMLEVMKACANSGKTVLVLDRPNPLGGEIYEGPTLDPAFTSFVGGAAIPLRHGLTIAELASLFRDEFRLDVELHLVPMEGWRRSFFYPDTGRRWFWPSPNMPTVVTSMVYPGQVLLEGVNLSEGRGTTRPFELAGAPYVDANCWMQSLDSFQLDGVRFMETRFQPTFDKWSGISCQGIEIQITEPSKFRSVSTTIALLATAAKLFPDFDWLPPPYEYEYEKLPIDILFGSDGLRLAIEAYRRNEAQPQEIIDAFKWDDSQWINRTERYRLYK
jgi:uncharacterized protein YbbC (DUF1343 family)